MARPALTHPTDLLIAARIPIEGEDPLEGELILPSVVRGIVVFVHGSGSSRHSPRNRRVAEQLRARGAGTLLFDLLSAREEALDQHTRALRFDIRLLADRLLRAADWLRTLPETQGLGLGYFGASTGAAAALLAAAAQPERVSAVVSRGGRPDLAGAALAQVRAPTLLLVGSLDGQVIELNERALVQLTAPRAMRIVPGAGHLFEEPGTLDLVARAASEWFDRHWPTRRVRA
jgi:putative phosphoribosyl transferase